MAKKSGQPLMMTWVEDHVKAKKARTTKKRKSYHCKSTRGSCKHKHKPR